MAIINPTLPNDGENADAADLTIPILAILAVINGGIESANLADSAVTTPKVADGAITDVKLADSAAGGWKAIATTPTTVTPLGQKSYTVLFPGVDLTDRISKGMRFRATRTTAAPTQCTNLNGTTQYYSKSSPSGMTFTNNFTVSAWIKLSSYATAGEVIVGRFNGTSGWGFFIGADGRVNLQGLNANSANTSSVTSAQSVPLNRWVHVAAQLDMLTFTATPTTSYVMLDGIDVPSTVTRAGTNPTALIQAGNLEIGGWNGGTSPFSGKIAQVAIYSAKVLQATILAAMNQTLSGSETSLISAYSFNNSINDLNANANNLTANGSAVATNADSPYAQAATAGLLEYGIVTGITYATNTTLTVQVPEGSALPSSGGLSAAAYAAVGIPYGFPKQEIKWNVELVLLSSVSASGTTINTVYNPGGLNINLPIGEWVLRKELHSAITVNASSLDVTLGLSTSPSAFTLPRLSSRVIVNVAVNSSVQINQHTKTDPVSVATATPYYILLWSIGPFSLGQIHAVITSNPVAASVVVAKNAYL